MEAAHLQALQAARLQFVRQSAFIDVDASGSTNETGQGKKWTPADWWAAFKAVFIDGADFNPGQDDMLFCVLTHAKSEGPYIVKRRVGNRMPPDLCYGAPLYQQLNWSRTFQLNVVLHSRYYLTVATCPQEDRMHVRHTPGMRPPTGSGTIQLTKTVYARTTKESVNLDNSRSSDSTCEICYPDICFTVDNFREAFEALVLRDEDSCFCVSLEADGWPQVEESDAGSTMTGSVFPGWVEALDRLKGEPSIPASNEDDQDSTCNVPAREGQAASQGPGSDSRLDYVGELLSSSSTHGSESHTSWAKASIDGSSFKGQVHNPTSLPRIKTRVPEEAGPIAESTAGDAEGEVFPRDVAPSPPVATDPAVVNEDTRPSNATDSVPKVPRVINLFTGFVSRDKLIAVVMRNSSMSSLLTGRLAVETRRVKMFGPGNCGLAEAVVTSFYGLVAPAPDRKESSFFGQLRDDLFAAVKGLGGAGVESISDSIGIQCALMTLQLPVVTVADKVLELEMLL